MNRILLLEDNLDMALALVKYFVKHGFEIDHFESFEEARAEVKEYNYDLYLLDINLPNASGYDAAKVIRRSDTRTPIIAITARDSIEDKLKGFDHGFNDYVVKPFDLRELMARVQTHIDQSKGADQEVITIGDFKIDHQKYAASYKGEDLKLTNIEFNILYALLKNANLLVRTDDLIEYAWGSDPDVFSPPVRMHISNLRKKINDADYTIIETVPGLGYRLNT